MIQGLLEYLNHYDTQDEVIKNANQIIRVFSDLISQTSDESVDLESHIEQQSNP